jgi:hypothetical protein
MGGDRERALRLLRSSGTLARRAGLELWARWSDVDLATALLRGPDAASPLDEQEAHRLADGAVRAAQRGGWPRLEQAAAAL